MKSSLFLATTAFFLATGALLGGGCQLIAGVHTDGELLGGGTGGTGTTSTTGGTGGATGGTGGVAPCQSPADCPGQVCLAGACVSPKCVPSGNPVVLFDSADLDGHTIDEKRMHLVADGDRIHVVVLDRDQPRLLARTWSNDPVNPGSTIVAVDLAGNGGSSFDFARLEDGIVYVHGRLGEQLGHVHFTVTGQTITNDAKFQSYPALPASCVQPNGGPTNVGFDHVGGATRYAVECQGQSGRTLLIGSETTSPEVVAQGAANDPTLHLRGYLDRADGVQLLLTGGGDSDPTLYRAGADVAALQATHAVALDADPNVLNFIANPIHSPAGDALFIGATVSSIDSKGALWGGVLSDYAALATVPPQGVNPILKFDAPPFNNLSDLEAHPSGFYAVGPSMDGKTLNVLWLDPSATTILVSFGAVASLPAGDTGAIVGASVVRGTLTVAAAYAILRDGAVSVEGTRFLCSY